MVSVSSLVSSVVCVCVCVSVGRSVSVSLCPCVDDFVFYLSIVCLCTCESPECPAHENMRSELFGVFLTFLALQEPPVVGTGHSRIPCFGGFAGDTGPSRSSVREDSSPLFLALRHPVLDGSGPSRGGSRRSPKRKRDPLRHSFGIFPYHTYVVPYPLYGWSSTTYGRSRTTPYGKVTYRQKKSENTKKFGVHILMGGAFWRLTCVQQATTCMCMPLYCAHTHTLTHSFSCLRITVAFCTHIRVNIVCVSRGPSLKVIS